MANIIALESKFIPGEFLFETGHKTYCFHCKTIFWMRLHARELITENHPRVVVTCVNHPERQWFFN